ncbi:MAG: hypothetical protein IJE43_17495 [Alphaproteobacteria bacterium]|nr:hypothetical protein [Alphaproteobacteria bacterium]
MRKYNKFFTTLMSGFLFVTQAFALTPNKNVTEIEPTTRDNAVIFKIHDIKPVDNEGVVTGCDFLLTLYNRTSVNFRSFTINLDWFDAVESEFKFDKYVENVIGVEELKKQQEFLGDKFETKPLQTAITVNAFGADTQISVKSHIDSEKCYLLLKEANFTVTPCDIVRSADNMGGASSQDCTPLFQLVDTSNPEYFGQFKNISATELAMRSKDSENRELSDIDLVINKIVENMGASGKTLEEIN